jgi:two-component system chemotaxis response regulator CheB
VVASAASAVAALLALLALDAAASPDRHLVAAVADVVGAVDRVTPVIVVSSYSRKENVFRALELGAVDFIAKPDGDTGQLEKIRDLLLQKLLLVRDLRQGTLSLRPGMMMRGARDTSGDGTSQPPQTPPKRIVAIASSTGGPTAVTEILSHLSAKRHYAVVIAQHMPEKFTSTFAQRLDRYSALHVTEGEDGNVIGVGSAFVCPGRRCMEVERIGSQYVIRTKPPTAEDRYVPNASRLFTSVARVFGARTIGVVLTGMGDDGVEGAKHIFEAGGTVIAESEETAVVYGMPRAAVRAGAVTRSFPLTRIASHLDELLR